MTVFPARVLLATGDGPDATPAIRAAVDLCERAGAELHVARVVRALPPHVYPDKRPEEYEDVYALQVGDALEEIVRPVEDAGGRVAGAHMRVGDDAAREVLRLGEEIGAGLIVLGGRDLGLIERLVGGSVREALIARAPVPVLVVGDGGWPPARVVVWDDSSEGARLAGELAVGVGGFYGASAVLLRVLPGGRGAEGRYEDSGEPFARWAARLEGLDGGRPQTGFVAGAAGKAALDAVVEAAEGGRALLALGAVGPGVPKRALRAVRGAVLVGPRRARTGRDGKRSAGRSAHGADTPRRAPRPAATEGQEEPPTGAHPGNRQTRRSRAGRPGDRGAG